MYPESLCSYPIEDAHAPWPAFKIVSCHIAEQLGLQDVLPFLILFARLKCFIIFPAYRLVALSARNIPHDVSAGRHVPLTGIARRDVDYVVEEVRFAMLAPEILTDHVSNGWTQPASMQMRGI
jgi:hypothetical protein